LEAPYDMRKKRKNQKMKQLYSFWQEIPRGNQLLHNNLPNVIEPIGRTLLQSYSLITDMQECRFFSPMHPV